MKLALVTTTINVPTVLKLYRKLGPDFDVAFFVAGDHKSPSQVSAFLKDIPWCRYYPVEDQRALGYECCELLGWNSDARRNIATLEALKWGAEIIVFVDDDNIPLGQYFSDVIEAFIRPHNGVLLTAEKEWLDQGALLSPPAKQRGVPLVPTPWRVDSITGARIGVVAGTCLGDPDIDAITRIALSPTVHQASDLLRSGCVVNNNSFAVFNSQNTAVLRELAPAMFIMPGSGGASHVGRNSDIFASVICRRVMKDRGLHMRVGAPFVWQQRNPHNLLRDLYCEQLALERIDEFARFVDRYAVPSDPLLPFLHLLYNELQQWDWWPKSVSQAAFAWINDCEKAMA